MAVAKIENYRLATTGSVSIQLAVSYSGTYTFGVLLYPVLKPNNTYGNIDFLTMRLFSRRTSVKRLTTPCA